VGKWSSRLSIGSGGTIKKGVPEVNWENREGSKGWKDTWTKGGKEAIPVLLTRKTGEGV